MWKNMHLRIDKMEYYANIRSQLKKLILLILISKMYSRIWCLRSEIKKNIKTKENEITEIRIMLPTQSVIQVILILKD